MIRYATVGTSRITENFTAACALTKQYKLAAVYSRDRERGRRFGAARGCGTVYTSLRALAADKSIDAVYIASPNVFHAPQSRIFLEAGKHVICEKPIATSAEEYRVLKELADQKGLIYSEAIMSYHATVRNAVKAALSEIGTIAAARIDFCQRSSRYDTFLRGERPNIFDLSLGAGTLTDLGIYCVYGAVDLLGAPEHITARASYLSNGCDGGGCAIFDYRGFQAVLSYSKTGQSAIGSEITGDRGTLKISSVSQYTGVTLVKDGTETEICGFPERAVLMGGEAAKFASYILHPAETRADYDSASALCLTVHRCMDEIKQSAGIFYPLRDVTLLPD